MKIHLQRVAAIHDLSGFGRASLTVIIPILSSMGIQVCPLPTAVLSSHSAFPDFHVRDLSDDLPQIIAHWKRLNIQFDAIYSGYLGAVAQIDIISMGVRATFGHTQSPAEGIMLEKVLPSLNAPVQISSYQLVD